MDNHQFSALCSKTWTLPVLALLADGRTARVSPLAHELETGRTSVSATFVHLVELGILVRNEGHGHPLRPEFALTEFGHAAAAWALTFRGQMGGAVDWRLARRSWTLPVLRLTDEASRYSRLRANLTPITDRALSLALKALQKQGWLERDVETERAPPQVRYVATGPGRLLMPGLRQSFSLAPQI